MTHLSDDTLQDLPAIVGLDPADVTRWSIDPSETQRTSQFQVVPSPAASSLASLDGSTVRRQMNRALLSERAGKGLLIPRNNSFAEAGVLSADVTDAESSNEVLPDEGSGAEAYDLDASDTDPSETAATHQYLRAIRHRDAERLLANMPEDRPTTPRFVDASEWVASEELLPSSPSLVSSGRIAAFSSGSLSSIDVDSSELSPKSSEPAFRLDSLADVSLVEVDVDAAIDSADEDAVRSDELYAFESEAYTTDLPTLEAREHLTADVPFPRNREDLTMDLPFRRTMESPVASFASSSRHRVSTSSPTSTAQPSQRNFASSSRIPVSHAPLSSRMNSPRQTKRSTSSFPPVAMSNASDEQWMALMPPPVFVEHAVTDLDLMIKDSTGSGPQSAHPTSPIIRRTPFHRSRFVSPGVGWGVMGIGLGVVLGALWVGLRSGESASNALTVPSVAAQPNKMDLAEPSVIRTPVATWTSPKTSAPIAPAVATVPVNVAPVVPVPVAAPLPVVVRPVPVVPPVVPTAAPVVVAPVAVVAPVVPAVAPVVVAPVVSAASPVTPASLPVVAPAPGEFSIDSLPLEPEAVLVPRKHKR